MGFVFALLRKVAARHVDFVVLSLLLGRGSAILKFGNKVDRSLRHSTGIGVVWPNFNM